jgi:hypothetical protein
VALHGAILKLDPVISASNVSLPITPVFQTQSSFNSILLMVSAAL